MTILDGSRYINDYVIYRVYFIQLLKLSLKPHYMVFKHFNNQYPYFYLLGKVKNMSCFMINITIAYKFGLCELTICIMNCCSFLGVFMVIFIPKNHQSN